MKLSDLGEPTVELSALGMAMLDAVLLHGHAAVNGQLAIAVSEIHINPRRYIQFVVIDKGFSGVLKIQRIKAVRYLGLRHSLVDAKRFVEELYG